MMIHHLGRSRRKPLRTLLLGVPVLSILSFLLLQLLLYQAEHHSPRPHLTILPWSQKNVPIDNRRIYFHETSGKDHLNVRQCCAVESAARHNPNRPVQIFLQTDKLNYSSPCLSVLEEYSNVVAILLNETEYFANTPLEKWYVDGEWKTSMYKYVHMADYIRMLTLYKGGGLYMDLDYVILKPLDERTLWNFILIEGPEMKLLSNSAFHLEHGHRLMKEIIKRLAKYYNPDEYFWHGPSLLSNVMSHNCSIRRGQPDSNTCADVKLLAHDYFSPITTEVWEKLFRVPTNKTFSLFRRSYAVHAWSGKSREEPLDLGSRQLYAVIAAEHCPLTVSRALPWA